MEGNWLAIKLRLTVRKLINTLLPINQLRIGTFNLLIRLWVCIMSLNNVVHLLFHIVYMQSNFYFFIFNLLSYFNPQILCVVDMIYQPLFKRSQIGTRQLLLPNHMIKKTKAMSCSYYKSRVTKLSIELIWST